MLHWPLNEHNKYWFILELVLMSAVLHGVLGVLLFVVYPTKRDSFCIELGKTKNPTLFMPLRNSISKGSSVTSSRSRASTTSTTSDGQLVQPVAEQISVIRKAQLSSDLTMGFQEKKLTQQARPKGKSAQTKKAAPQVSRHKKNTRNVRKPVPPAKNNKKTGSKVEPKKKQPEKKEPPKNIKREDKKSLKPMQPQMPQRESESKVPPTPEAPEIKEQSLPQHNSAQQEQAAVEGMSIEQVVLGNEPVDGEYISAEQARMYECIEQEIVSHWRPPCGLPKDLVCHIKCSIGNDGSVTSCMTEKSSGVLIYDMAARMASLALKLPRWAWEKDFTIVYKQ